MARRSIQLNQGAENETPPARPVVMPWGELQKKAKALGVFRKGMTRGQLEAAIAGISK